MRIALVVVAAAATAAGVAAGCASGAGETPPLGSAAQTVPDTLCADPARAFELCPVIPHDVAVTLAFGYTGLVPQDQMRFDAFSWQSFVALNWPADANGNPLPGPIGSNPSAPRVWETYTDAATLFAGNDAGSVCDAGAGRLLLQMAKNGQVIDPDGSFDEAVGGPLIDRNGNFAVFEKKVNPREERFIDSLNLTDPAVQDTFTSISFPVGYYDDPSTMSGGEVGAMELKAAWRIVTPADDSTRYYTRRATIFVPAANSATGGPQCIDATVALVGLHIIQKTTAFPQWVWTTFEHVDNAPTCPAGSATCGEAGVRYSFFDAACPDCTPNDTVSLRGDSAYLWTDSVPYAARYLTDGRYGSQIVRVVPVPDYTESVNALWREKLAGTVWANYRLIGSQWQSGDSPSDRVDVPDTLGNSTLESYIPTTSSCIHCHAFATTTNGTTKADFSFLLSMARADTALMHPPDDGDRFHIGGF